MVGTEKQSSADSALPEQQAPTQQQKQSGFGFNKVAYTWEANDRPTYSFTGSQKSVFSALVILVGLYFFWVGQPVLTLVTAAIFFAMFSLLSFPPTRVKHSIETMGIRSMDFLYGWEDLIDFWVAEKEGSIIIYINTRLRFPGRLVFLVETFQEAVTIVNYFAEHLPYKVLNEPQPAMERSFEGKYVVPDIFIAASQDMQKKS
jgi:hypothetical protein